MSKHENLSCLWFADVSKKGKKNKAFVIQSGMNQYYVILKFYKDKQSYILYNDHDEVRIFKTIDAAARCLRQLWFKDIRVEFM